MLKITVFVLTLNGVLVLSLAQESSFRFGYSSPNKEHSQTYHEDQKTFGSERRNFDRDGLLVSPALMPGVYSQSNEEQTFPMTASSLIANRNYPMMAGHHHYPYPYPGYMQHSEPFVGSTTAPHSHSHMMMLLSGAPEGVGPYPPMGYLPYAPPFAHMQQMMAPSMYQYYPRMSQHNSYQYGSSPKIEIGQKLSNSIYANSDTLRYDIPSSKDYRTQYSPYSSSVNQQFQYPHQSYSHHSPSYSSSIPSSYQSSDYALASNGYRQYLAHSQPHPSQTLMSNPLLYSRISQYMPYLTGSKYPSQTSSFLADQLSTSRSPDSSYSKGGEYLKSAQSSSSSHSTLPSPSSTSSASHSSDHSKASKVANSVKEEIGFFKRNDSTKQ